MEEEIKQQLGLDYVKPVTRCFGTNNSEIVDTNHGKMFIKIGGKEFANEMVIGEFESLKEIQKTGTIHCPEPICILLTPGHSALVTSYIDMKRNRSSSKKLGKELASMHQHNSNILKDQKRCDGFIHDNSSPDDEDSRRNGVKKFGFHVPTCCGILPQENEWADDWTTFFIRHRLQPQIRRILEKGDRCLLDKEELIYQKTEELLKCRQNVVPSLVHGDLWGGNWNGCSDSGEPIIFDPSSSFSDPEFEQGIMELFGGLTDAFLSEYHKNIQEQDGREGRIRLYELYHLLNHWNHFGGSYKYSALSSINSLIKN